MGLSTLFDAPWYGGETLTSSIPGTYDVAIAGHGYMIDSTFEFGRRDSFRHSSIPAVRTATDITNEPGEGSINTQGLWRREIYDWSMGAGQRFFDRDGSFPNRFRASKGIDPFTNQWYATMLHDTHSVLEFEDPVGQVLVAGAYCYVMNSSSLYYSLDLSTWTEVAGLPGGLVMMTTDGYNVYVIAGTGGLYTMPAGGAVTHYGTSSDDLDFVAFCSDVLLVAVGPSMYQITATYSTLPEALITSGDPNFTWNCACGGYGWIYIGGFSGNNSKIYATQYEATGIALTAPTISGPLPTGEIAYSLYAFVNFVLVGTSQGARFSITLGPVDAGGSPGDLKMGPLVPNLVQPVTRPVRCFTSQDRFVWFGWSNYDSESTGLGKLNISQYTGDQTPSYCSDLMVSGQGEITSMDFFLGAPVFTVDGRGVFTTLDSYVGSATINSGYITFGIPDKKVLIAYSVDVVEPINGTIGASITADDGSPISLGTSTADPPPIFSIAQLRGELFETTLTLNSTPLEENVNSAPTIRRATLQGIPTIAAGIQIIAALRFFVYVETNSGRRFVNVPNELQFLENLRAAQQVVTYQEGKVTYQVTVTDIDMVFYEKSDLPQGGFNGVCVCTMQTLGGVLN